MENYTIYSHTANFELLLQKVKEAFPKSTPDVSSDDEVKRIILHLKGGLFGKNRTLKIQYRQRLFPTYHLKDAHCAVSQQFTGMYNFVASLPAKDTRLQDLLLRKIETLNAEIAFMADPDCSSDISNAFRELVTALNAIVFVPPGQSFSKSQAQHFLDHHLQLLIDAQGNTGPGNVNVQIESRYFDDPLAPTDEQAARKQRSEQLLTQHGIKVNAHLPVTESEAETVLRSKEDIVERIYCLTVIAAKGEGVEQEMLDQKCTELGIRGFTPGEIYIYNQPELSDQDKANATWRYESLNVLMWAVSMVDTLVYPSEICNVQAIVGMVINQSRTEFEKQASCRSKREILEALDQTYRMNWACVDARLNSRAAGGGINPSIIYERHYALNWLVNYMEQEWDDVSTDT